MAWFKDVSQLVEALFVGSHIGPGGVPRGTEVQTLSCENVEECPRTIFVMHGYVASVIRYNKTQHNMQMDKHIARFFPPRLGRLFLYYLAIVRPLEKIWADEVFGVGESCNYRHLAFVRFAKPMTSPQFSKVLYESSLHHINIGLGIHDYRQFIKAVLRIVLNIDHDKLGDEGDTVDPADSSFGHSREIGNTYGLSYNDLPHLTSDLLRVHQKYCERVHRWLGESGPLPEHTHTLSMAEMTSTFNKMHDLIDRSLERNPSRETITTIIKEAATDVIRAEVQHKLTPAIQAAVTSEISCTVSNMPWQYLIGADTKVPEDCHLPVVVQLSTLRSLRRFLGNDATPKSPEQARLLQLVLDRQCNVIGVLPTGGGKSVVYQAPAICEASGITVSIFPFRALTQDRIIQAEKLRIPVATWPVNRSRSVNDDDLSFYRDKTRLVCVSAHHAGEVDFLYWLRGLFRAGILNRVVVDEAHELLMSEYRACISNLREIRQLAVPIICLSATLTPAAIPSLMEFFGFTSSTVRIVRADTPRPSVAYHAVRVAEEDLFPAIVQEIKQFPLEGDERGLVFCNTYKDCELLSAMTGIPVYYGGLDEHEKDQNADKWRRGEVLRLICTSGFGNGVNYPHCRHVVHCRSPEKMCRYVQETGRAGRDGRKARAVLFYIEREVPCDPNVKAPDAAGQLAMSQYVSQRNQCRRLAISSWSDGKERVQSCSSIPAAELCDWCMVRFFRLLLH